MLIKILCIPLLKIGATTVKSQRMERMVGDYLIKINNYNYNNYNLPRFSPLSEIEEVMPHPYLEGA
jgi:hypothetical protein